MNEATHTIHKAPHQLGLLTILLIFGLLGTWAALAKIDVTVQAGGKIISQGYKKVVMHPKGGIVTKIFVQEGQFVHQGDLLLALDDTDIDTQLQSAIKQHDEYLSLQDRRLAESHYLDKPNFQKTRQGAIDQGSVEKLIQKEAALFRSSKHSLNLKLSLYRKKNSVLKEQNHGLEQRIASYRTQLQSYQDELHKWQELYEQNMTDELKLLNRKRKIENIRSRIQAAQSKIKENLATIASNNNQAALEKSTYIDRANKDLKEIGIKIATLKERIRSLQNAKAHQILTAPADGYVTNMQIHAVGEVVSPQKPILYIVPKLKALTAEVYILPTDIEKIHLGQEATIMFPSYVDPSAETIKGKVTYVSADAFTPEKSQVSLYKILIEITPEGMEAIKKNGFKIVTGMPVSAYIKAEKRSFLSYILQPLIQLSKGAFHAN